MSLLVFISVQRCGCLCLCVCECVSVSLPKFHLLTRVLVLLRAQTFFTGTCGLLLHTRRVVKRPPGVLNVRVFFIGILSRYVSR